MKMNKAMLNDILGAMNYENEFGFDSFREELQDRFATLGESEMDDIQAYIESELNVYCDADIYNTSQNERHELIHYINEMLYD